MTQTRQILDSVSPDHGIVFTQELLADGTWYNRSARRATPQELMSQEPALTGSSNTHARLPPSDSKRWTQCTASIAFQEANAHRLPRKSNTKYSDEGTEAHEWAAKVLLGKCQLPDVPKAMRDPVGAYVEYCKSRTPEGISYQVEVEVPLFYQEEQTGTCDFAVVTEGLVEIVDYKHGAGVLVTAQENTQLAIYAYSLIKLLEDVYDFSPATVVNISIFQPRHREGSEQTPWVTTLSDLAKFCEVIDYQAIKARNAADRVRERLPLGERDVAPDEILEAAPGAVFHAEDGDGGSCRWCKSKAFCGKRLDAIAADTEQGGVSMETLLEIMPDLTKPEAKLPLAERLEVVATQTGANLTDEYLVKLFRKSKPIGRFLEDVAEYLATLASEGRPVEGTKLVMGREGNRAWTDEDAADTFLANQKISADERFTKKLISVTTAEKLLDGKELTSRAKTRFDQLVTRSAAQKTLALAEDKRMAVDADVNVMPDLAAADDFEV